MTGMHDDVMTQLKRHLASADEIDVSRYQFINIEEVRENAGALWPEIRERVFLASRSIIERKVADNDLIIQCATGFLVIFKALSGSAAARLTESIRGEMERFFMGDDQLRAMRAEASSEQLSIEEFQATLADADLDTAAPSADMTSPPGGADAPHGFDSVVFAPLWDAKREAVVSFIARPRCRNPDGAGWISGTDVYAHVSKPAERLALDRQVLAAAARALDTLLKSGARCAVIAPAGFSALSNPRMRSEYVTAFAALPRELRKLIWVRLEDASADAPVSALEETSRILLGHTRRLFIHTRFNAVSLDRFTQTGAGFIGADFPAGSGEAARQDAERFVAITGRIGAGACFDALKTWEQVRLVSRTQARLLAGPAVGEFDAPCPPYRLTRAGLLARAA